MSLLGKIQALFADKERTQAIFPLTKVKAISDDDGTGLDAILDRAVYTDDGVIETSVVSRDADTLGGLPAATYATTSFVKNEILNSQVGGDAGEIDLSGLATKDELSSKVDKAGDTMTGDLTISSGDWPSILLKATGATNAGYLEGSKNSTGSLCLWSQNTADNNATRRGLRLVNSEGNSSIANALILSDLAEGVARKDYKIYGEHNKPTAADVGALPISGGTATGPVAVSGNNNTVTMGTGANDVYIRNTTSNKYLQLKNDGTLSYDNKAIYHTGNKPTATDVGAVPLSGNSTITGSTSDTPLRLRSKATRSYIGFQNSSGTDLGFYGFSAANTPVVYVSGAAKKVYHEGNKPTASAVGAAPAVADSTYTSCYYRTVDGVKEWINPPMVFGTEYRTTERFNKKVVYTKLVDCGKLTAGGYTKVSVSLGSKVIRYLATNNWAGIPNYDDSVPTYKQYVYIVNPSEIQLYNGSSNTNTTASVQVWYIK